MPSCTRKTGLKLNPDKCCICVTEVGFFGHKLTAEGLKPEPLKVKAVHDMKPPENAAELETILGLDNCYNKNSSQFTFAHC